MDSNLREYYVQEDDNLLRYFLENRDRYKERQAYRYYENGQWHPVSWNTFLDNIKRFASAMLNAGVRPGDKIVIFAPNSPKWAELDYACAAVRAVSVPAHINAASRSLKSIIEETEPKLIFAGNAELAAKLQGLADPKITVVISGAFPGCRTLYHFSEGADRADWCDSGLAAVPDDLWTIVYTSGTTGDVRGAMLTYRTILHQIRAHRLALPNIGDSDSSFCLLPLSHIFERAWSAVQYSWGMTHHYCPGRPTEAIRSLKSAHPSIMCTVPRLLEKIYAAFKDGLEKKPAWFRRIIDLALKTGEQYYGALSGGKKPSIWLRARRAFYDRLILSRVRELFGGRLKHCVVGSAALIPEVHRFFQSVGIFINNGYGLTETTATVAHTPLGHSLPGTVGTTLHGIEVRLGEDSEIQVKGPTVMSGYFKREADTAAAFTEDGFFRTGDVGEFLENGYLRITDRLKEFLRTSTGLYVSPQHLEQRLSILPYIDQAAVVGEGHSWVGALLVPNFDKLRDKARSWGAECLDNAALIIDKTVLSHVQKDIDELLANEMNHEKVRRIALIEHPFTIDNEELTPTLKLRRRAINSHYHQLIEQMFS